MNNLAKNGDSSINPEDSAKLAKIEDISEQFKVKSDGQVFVSISGLARLCGVNEKAIRDASELKTAKITKFLATQGLEGSELITEQGIPDTVAVLIIEYYAFEAGKNCKEQAIKTFRSFAAIGFRTYVQGKLGFKKTSTDLAAQVIMGTNQMLKGKVSEIELIKIQTEGLIKVWPENEEVWKQTEKVLINREIKLQELKKKKVEEEKSYQTLIEFMEGLRHEPKEASEFNFEDEFEIEKGYQKPTPYYWILKRLKYKKGEVVSLKAMYSDYQKFCAKQKKSKKSVIDFKDMVLKILRYTWIVDFSVEIKGEELMLGNLKLRN